METGRSRLRKAVEALGPEWSHEIRRAADGDPAHEQRLVVVFRRAGQRYFLVGGEDEEDTMRKALDWVDRQSPGSTGRG